MARRGSPWRVLIVVGPIFAWAGAASWLAYDRGETADRLKAEKAAQRTAYEDKVRALTRRLVGVASHQMLEQDGLAGRLSDIITRQVELENRLATLAGYAERLGDPSAPPSPAEPARPPAEAPSEPGVLRLGAPRGISSGAVKPTLPVSGTGQRSGVEDERRGTAGERIQAMSALSPREQFDGLDRSLDRAERTEIGLLARFGQTARTISEKIRTALAVLDLGLPAMAAARAAVPRGSSFEEGVQALDAGLDELRRWRTAADAVPLRRPIEGLERALTSNFGTRKDPFTGAATMHAGMDFRAPVGTGVQATGVGRVITAEATGGYGNLVEIDHGNGVVTRYAHLSAYAVSVGQTVRPDTVVGMVGSTGRSTGPHLHYETRLNGTAIDPARFLKVGAALLEKSQSDTIPASPGFADDARD